MARQVPPVRIRPLRSTAGAAGVGEASPAPVTRPGDRLWRDGPYFASTANLLEGWLDSYLDGGVDAGIGDLRRSSAHYSWALDLHAPRGDEWWRRIALAWVVLGRSEFVGLRAPTSVSGPHVTPNGFANLPYLCVDPNRHDYADTTLGIILVQVVDTPVLSLACLGRSTTRASGQRTGRGRSLE
jgi:hypothetical protein